MPSKARYEREKARAAQEGTTPYQKRVAAAESRYGPKTTRGAIRGHPEEPTAGISSRRRARQEWRREHGLRAVYNRPPGRWCVVCGADKALTPGARGGGPRTGSYVCRPCGAETMRRYRQQLAEGNPASDEYAHLRGFDRLSRDQIWVAQRRRDSRSAGIPIQEVA